MLAYGDRMVHIKQSSFTGFDFTALTTQLHNTTTHHVDLLNDCDMEVIRSPYARYSAGQVPLAPRAEFERENSTHGNLVPAHKPLQFQIVAFNISSNVSDNNETFFRVYDMHVSRRRGRCTATEVSPDVEMQKQIRLGAGTLACTARNDDLC